MFAHKEKRSRIPVAAVLLSLVGPGLGQIYCGRFAKGIVLLFVSLTLMPLGLFGFVPVASWFGTAAFLASLGFMALWIYAMVDAGRTAKRIGPEYVLKDYNRWYVYVFLALLSVPIALGLAVYIRSGIVEAFKVPTHSMYPAIRPGDRILVNKLAYRRGPVQRGDLVVFINPNQRCQHQIKRVVALPGDRVERRSNELYINGKKLARTEEDPPDALSGAPFTGKAYLETNDGATYRVLIAPGSAEGDLKAPDLPELTVPNGHCFALGDNRNRSQDSRDYGPVPLADIVGRVEHVFFPRWESLLPAGRRE